MKPSQKASPPPALRLAYPFFWPSKGLVLLLPLALLLLSHFIANCLFLPAPPHHLFLKWGNLVTSNFKICYVSSQDFYQMYTESTPIFNVFLRYNWFLTGSEERECKMIKMCCPTLWHIPLVLPQNVLRNSAWRKENENLTSSCLETVNHKSRD